MNNSERRPVLVSMLGDDSLLLTDSQEIAAVLQAIDYPPEYDCNHWGALFVKQGKGEYIKVYATVYSTPLHTDSLTCLWPLPESARTIHTQGE